jgi:hypothetical protein
MIPGTSCLATIVLSLRDKTIRPSKRLAIILALMGFQPWEPTTPERRALKGARSNHLTNNAEVDPMVQWQRVSIACSDFCATTGARFIW